GEGGAVRAAGEEDAGLLEQLAGRGDVRRRRGGDRLVLGADLAAGEGREAAHEAQAVGPADEEDLVAGSPQQHAGGGRGGAHAPPSAGGGGASLPFRPRSTASSSFSMANGLRMYSTTPRYSA